VKEKRCGTERFGGGAKNGKKLKKTREFSGRKVVSKGGGRHIAYASERGSTKKKKQKTNLGTRTGQCSTGRESRSLRQQKEEGCGEAGKRVRGVQKETRVPKKVMRGKDCYPPGIT